MKKHILLLAGFLLLSSSLLHAQDPCTNVPKSIAKSIKSHKNLEVALTMYSKETPGAPFDKKDGVAYIENDSYRIVFDDIQVISDGKTLWTHYIEDLEAMVSNANEDNTVSQYFELLNESKGSFLGKDDDGNQIIGLHDKYDNYQDINLVVDKKGELKKLDFVGDNEEVIMRLEIRGLKYDQTFEDGFFSFDEKAYPGVDIIDMR